jgi:hypothetical protein
MLEDAIEEIRRTFDSGKRFERKGAYAWALARYIRAATMIEMLMRLHMGGQIQINAELLSILQELSARLRSQTDALSLKLGNGHGLSGSDRKGELAEILHELTGRIDEILTAF